MKKPEQPEPVNSKNPVHPFPAHTVEDPQGDLLAIMDQLAERIHELESRVLPPPAETPADDAPMPHSRWNSMLFKAKLALYRTTRNTKKVIKYRHKLAGLTRPIGRIRKVGIMSPPHTDFVAKSIEQILLEVGLEAGPIEYPNDGYDIDLYIVLCPQAFQTLPPGHRTVVYQFEQCQHARWQRDSYLRNLRAARAVLDYSTDNLVQLAEHDIDFPRTYHVGVQARNLSIDDISPPGPGEDSIDVLFYGATNSERRRRLLEALQQRLPVRVESELFGPALQDLLRRTRVVVNLHYYDDALLETTRIHECLSHGVAVVTETCVDQIEHGHLSEWVSFVELGNVEALAEAIRQRLAQPRRDMRAFWQECESRFRFQFGRFLLAENLIGEEAFMRLTRDWTLPSDTICLTLPEAIERHQRIRHQPPIGASIFEGLRQPIGWQGCGLSYKYLFTKAIEQNLTDLLVVEDDVELTGETIRRLHDIRTRLRKENHRWDIFAGLIADVHPDTQVLDVEDCGDHLLVTVDRMTSMVCNIYGRRAMQLISRWKMSNKSAHRNTIDRYLQQYPTLRTVTTLPFLAGHRSESHSTLWGIENSCYDPMIAASQRRLQDKVDEFLRARTGRTRRQTGC